MGPCDQTEGRGPSGLMVGFGASCGLVWAGVVAGLSGCVCDGRGRELGGLVVGWRPGGRSLVRQARGHTHSDAASHACWMALPSAPPAVPAAPSTAGRPQAVPKARPSAAAR